MNVHSIIHNSQRWKQWMNEECCADTCYNVGESWKHDTKWKKPDIIGNILLDYICMNI